MDKTGWPTPIVNDFKGSAYCYGPRKPTGGGRACFLKLPGAAALAEGKGSWATPTTRDHKDGDCSSQIAGGAVEVNSLLGRQVLLATGGLAHSECERGCSGQPGGQDATNARESSEVGDVPGATNGFWQDAEWIPCRDGKARPVEPGTFPLAHGAPARVGRLRAYGNAIVAEAAVEFISAYLDAERAAKSSVDDIFG